MQEIVDRGHPWATTLILHNWPVLLYTVIAVTAAGWAFVRPTRSRLLVLYGATLLLVAYEYQKHGTTTILNTTGYLFSSEVNPGLRIMSQWILLGVAPATAQTLGFAILIGPIAWQLLPQLGRAPSQGAISDSKPS